MQQYYLGMLLHKTLDEIGQMTAEEFDGWMIFLKILRDGPENE